MLADLTSAELTGWIAYLQVDDEVQVQRLVYGIVRAFNGDKKDQRGRKPKEEDEEIIDTTDPEFAKHFQGFIHEKPQQARRPRQTSTDILIG